MKKENVNKGSNKLRIITYEQKKLVIDKLNRTQKEINKRKDQGFLNHKKGGEIHSDTSSIRSHQLFSEKPKDSICHI